MGHYWIFLLGMVVGFSVGLFVLALCHTAREDYFYGPEEYPTTKNEKKTCDYLLDNGS